MFRQLHAGAGAACGQRQPCAITCAITRAIHPAIHCARHRNRPGQGDRPALAASRHQPGLEQNKTLAAARKEIEAADATILQAGARPNPEFSALIEDTRKSSRTTTYQINQPIELGGKRSARIEAAQRCATWPCWTTPPSAANCAPPWWPRMR
jgi:hypothetical protein